MTQKKPLTRSRVGPRTAPLNGAAQIAGWANNAYEKTLNANALDTGHISSFVGTWQSAGTNCNVQYLSGYGSTVEAGLSFPLVNIDRGAAIISATLHYEITSKVSGTNLKLSIETPETPSVRWGNTPDGPVSATALDSVTGLATTEAVYAQDVTSLVQQAVNHANFVFGDHLKFWFEGAIDEAMNLNIGGWSGSATAGTVVPRLKIVYGLTPVKFDTPGSFLYRAAPFSGSADPLDNLTLSVWVKRTSPITGAPKNVLAANSTIFPLSNGYLMIQAQVNEGFSLRDSVGAPALLNQGTKESAASDGWTHWCIRAERESATPAERYKVWKNGVQVIGSDWFAQTKRIEAHIKWFISGHGDDDIDRLGAVGLGSAFVDGAIAALWFSASQTGDSSGLADASDFITEGGTPKFLGPDGATPNGVQPLLYFDGLATEWSSGVNRGSGGNFVLTGAISDA